MALQTRGGRRGGRVSLTLSIYDIHTELSECGILHMRNEHGLCSRRYLVGDIPVHGSGVGIR